MEGTKIIKGYCDKSKQYYGLEIKKFGSEWRVVNFTHLTDEEASVIYSEIRQPVFQTDGALLPCLKCGSRTVGGCNCSPRNHACTKGMKYAFDCVYCKNMVIDYSIPTATRGRSGEKITLAQGKEVKIVTFSNVTWKKFDKIVTHSYGSYTEVPVHVSANEKQIEFHGYHVSQMDEGVIYNIGRSDDFEIECDINTSTIQPHPGGKLYISLGIIKAEITNLGGTFYLGGRAVATVGTRFHMRLSLKGGIYEVYIDGKKMGEQSHQERDDISIVFGFAHDSHYCEILSHAYVTGISMTQGIDRQ